jgi:carbon-monoxide dehydrogenase large subunit
MDTYSVIGKPIIDMDIVRKATGAAIYTDDMKLPGMLFGKILRSNYPHARILSIDTSKARQLPGVKAVITGRDVPPRMYGVLIKDKLTFALDRVRYLGDEIAAVAAVDIETAQEACDLIKVEYEELPAVFNPIEAMKEGAPLLHEQLADYEKSPIARPVPNSNISSKYRMVRGNVQEGFSQADCVFEDEFKIASVHTCPLENMSCIAQVDPLDNVTVYSGTQSPYEVRDTIAECLDIPLNHIRVIVPFLGGGFGGKFFVKGELACVFLAKGR